MSYIHRLSTDSSIAIPRARGRLVRPLAAAALIGLIAVGGALASTPVVDGYRDQAYGGGAFRPTSEKPQSKLWYTDGTWFAGMFLYRTSGPPKSEYRIHRLDEATQSWIDTGVVLDTRDRTKADYLWVEAEQTLWVASSSTPPADAPDDSTKVFKYIYNPVANTYTLAAGFPKVIPGTTTTPTFDGGSASVVIARESSGRLWTAWAKGTEVLYSISSDDGVTWSIPAQVPVQSTNTIRPDSPNADIASIIQFGSSIGVMWSDQDRLPTADDDGFYFAVIAEGADPTVGANWSLEELPTLVPGALPREVADDHINMKATSDGQVYMVGKTGKDTANCATNKQMPLVELFRRTAAGVWSAHLVSTVGDCNTRPQLVLDQELGVAYVFMTAPNGAGYIYVKSAPLTGPEALKFRGIADQTIQRGTPFIRSLTETAIDDPTTTKQNVNSSMGIAVLANNIFKASPPNSKYYMHNFMSLPATDVTPPSGTVAISDGAAYTTTTQIVASLTATDSGSGMSLVRLSNSDAVDGNGLLTTGTTFNYTPAIAWNLAAGADGVRTLYAQFRDAKGNWSEPTSDAITLDANAPTGTIAINGGAAATTSRNVNLNLTAADGGGSGVVSVRISNTTDFSASTPIPYAATVPWTLTAGDGLKTVYVKFVDAAGNTSIGFHDSITLDAAPTGSVVVNGGSSYTNSTSVSLTFPSTSSDVTHVRVGNTFNLSASPWLAYTAGMTLPHTITTGNGLKHVYAQFRDGNLGVSSVVQDAINLDTTAPTGSVRINNGAAVTSTRNVTLTFPSPAGSPNKVRVGTSSNLSAVPYQAFTAGMSLPLTLTAGDGTKTAYAQFQDAAGNNSVVYSDTITLDSSADTVKPTVPGAPVHRVAGAVTTGFPIRLTWTASTDSGSGVANYILQQSINGGAYATIASPTGTSIDLQLSSSSKTYRFRVAARDHDGNASAYATGISFKTISTSESGAAMSYSGSWPLANSSAFIGGKAKYSTSTGASATLTFTGNRVAWLSQKGPSSGVARIYIDGKLKATVNLYSPTTINKQVVYQKSWTAVTTRTLRVVVVGTAGHPKLTIDQFFSVR